MTDIFFSFLSKVSDTLQESDGEVKCYARYKYPNMSKTLGNFKLEVMEGEFTDSQIIVMPGGERYRENDLHPDAGRILLLCFLCSLWLDFEGMKFES